MYANKLRMCAGLAACVVAGMTSVSLGQTGACCTAGVCTVSTPAGCVGVFNGAGSCNPNPCAVIGVCCRGATCNASLTSVNCTHPSGNAGAQFVASGACNAPGNSTTPCCYADYNKQSGITVGDIFDYLNDWFAGSPYAKVGGNAGPTDSALSVQDIFDFLNVWFAGC
jgi:hypothetical protein